MVQLYSLDKPTVVVTDASETVIAAVLMQGDHPVFYVFGCLSPAEQRYPNVEREALAIVWALGRLHQFLLGRKFEIMTDHKPMEVLFGENRQLPKIASARMNWATRIMHYDYVIRYYPGTEIPHVDTLTRLKFSSSKNVCLPDKEHTESVINSVAFEKSLVPVEEVRAEYDDFLKRIVRRVSTGEWTHCSEMERLFLRCVEFLTVKDGILFQGTRVVIPPRLRTQAIEIAHEVHSGTQSTLRRLQLAAWWPGMKADVERYLYKCLHCAKARPRLSKSVDRWPLAEPLERWYMDQCQANDTNVFVIVDAGSGWIEAFPSHSRTTAMVIKFLRTIFRRFGVAKVLVSDNAPEFVGDELAYWLRMQDVHKLESPPYHPRVNGIAERSVRIIKDALKAFTNRHGDLVPFLQKIFVAP